MLLSLLKSIGKMVSHLKFSCKETCHLFDIIDYEIRQNKTKDVHVITCYKTFRKMCEQESTESVNDKESRYSRK